jgi:hydroxyacylglutathione hydrolase
VDEAHFVRGLISGVRPRPPSVDRIVAINKGASIHGPREPAELSPDAALEILRGHGTVLDGRLPADFDDAHIAGSINLPLAGPGVGTRAGWVLDPDEPILIIAGSHADAQRMTRALHAVSLWDTPGYLLVDGASLRSSSLPVARADSWNLQQLAAGLQEESVELVDVRDASEWMAGHVPGSHHLPLHRLRDDPGTSVPPGRTTAVACAGGNRAAFAASLLRSAGRNDVVRVAGGGIVDLPAHGVALAVDA